jgi:hypothetical protein
MTTNTDNYSKHQDADVGITIKFLPLSWALHTLIDILLETEKYSIFKQCITAKLNPLSQRQCDVQPSTR